MNRALKHLCAYALILAIPLLVASKVFAVEPDSDMRYFMFIGEPSAKAWQFMMDDPADRKESVATSFKALGGKIINYFFGLGDGKNYIIVAMPNDNELIQAVYLMRMPSGLLNSYKIVELMPSDQMTGALKRSKALIQADTTVKK